MTTTIKVYEETRRKLKLLAALLDKSMLDVVAELVDKAPRVERDDGRVATIAGEGQPSPPTHNNSRAARRNGENNE